MDGPNEREVLCNLVRFFVLGLQSYSRYIGCVSGEKVTEEDKKKRAEEIAKQLGDNKKWKSHGRPINIEELEGLKLQIKDFSDMVTERNAIRDYYNLLNEFTKKYNVQLFIHTRNFI